MPRRKKKHPGTIERRGSAHRVILYAGGERHTFTVRSSTRADAEAFAREKHKDLTAGAKRLADGYPAPPRLSAFLDRFTRDRLPLLAPRTRETYTTSLDLFRRFFTDVKRDPTIDAVRSGHITEYMTWRRSHPAKGKGTVSARTVARDRAVLHAVFAYADELELREGNPVRRTRPPKVETRDPVILSNAEYERLLRECDEDDMLRLYVLTLGETGARSVSEALRLKWPDVDLEEGFIWIPSDREGHRTKSGKGRWVPMTPRLQEAMREHFARYRLGSYGGKRPAYLFHHTRARRGAKAGDRIRSLRSPFARAIRRAELPDGFRPHDLRHRRVTTWLAEGKNPVHVKEAVGHSDLRTTMGYTHLAREHLRSLVGEKESPKEELRDLRS